MRAIVSAISQADSVAPARPLDELLGTLDHRTRDVLERRWSARPKGRGWLVRRALLAADLAGLLAAFLVSYLLFGGTAVGGRLSANAEVVVFLLTLPAWAVLARFHGLYDRDEARADHSTVDDLVGVLHLVTLGAWGFFIACWSTGVADPNPQRVVSFWAFAIALVALARSFARGWCRRSAAYQQNTIIVGAGHVGQLVARKLMKHPEYGINLVGFVDESPRERRGDLEHLALLGSPNQLAQLVELLDVERVVIAFSNEADESTMQTVRTLRDLDVQVDIVPRLFEVVGPRADIHTVEGLPLIGVPPTRMPRSSLLIKRTVDVIGAGVGLILTAPLFALIALMIKRDSPGPVFFRQTRLGLDMREFTALKFRTMQVDVDQSVHREYIKATMTSDATLGANGLYKLDRADAVTRVGTWLRKTSLDELPQLINVLRGDMSLVGPRPCIPYETENFAPHQFARFGVPAGVTGLWQVTARASSTFGEALEMDVAYARGWSLGLDLRLLCRTPVQLFRQKRATA